ncbi:hypothetical protein [Acidisoma silvae]|uniref:Uncharacterized protein n=1 Tax=Acidisoma silvae TaxID=2802396 RepID=A0A963YUA1_9PROT|nr:hypothetical protein [Acidisoma silvae]MCB8877195.1 hypothetical protein [Acidisoma silvae]
MKIAKEIYRRDPVSVSTLNLKVDAYKPSFSQSDDWIKDLMTRVTVSRDDASSARRAASQARWEEFHATAAPRMRLREIYAAILPAITRNPLLTFAAGFIVAVPLVGLALILTEQGSPAPQSVAASSYNLSQTTTAPLAASAPATAPVATPGVPAALTATPPVPSFNIDTSTTTPVVPASATTPQPAQSKPVAPAVTAGSAAAAVPAAVLPPLHLRLVFAPHAGAPDLDGLAQRIGQALHMAPKVDTLPIRARNSAILYFSHDDQDLARRVAQTITQLTGQTIPIAFARKGPSGQASAIEIDLSPAAVSAVAQKGF